MTELSEAKTLGGVGAILVLLGVVPNFGFILSIVGWILILVSVDKISKTVNDRTIFNNVLMAVILAVVGSIIAGVILGVGVFFAFTGTGAVFPGDPTRLLTDVLGFFVVGLIAFWLIMIFSARYLRRGYDSINAQLRVSMFSTAGKLYFYGALLTIILVGFILILIAEILQVIAFFSMPESLPSTKPTSGNN
ncbi:MAG: DUF996 domain-containing protein [Thaumarchaeota archaeon]|nr:DUF996 domain-containing protein [Candidatus Calditenuaceae archaeon]MDW8187038.1 DUF996 domain-containing protein [Nitrososphaerota archaeon]